MRMLFLLIIVGISSAAMADLKSDEVAYYQNLADSPTIVSIQDGDWGDTAAWDPGRTPGYGDRVLVAHQVRLNGIHTDPVATIDITGEIYTNRKQKIELHFDTMLVNETGTLRMGDGNKGITQKQRLVVHDIDGGALDELSRAQGIINIGTVHLRGKRVKPYLGQRSAALTPVSG